MSNGTPGKVYTVHEKRDKQLKRQFEEIHIGLNERHAKEYEHYRIEQNILFLR